MNVKHAFVYYSFRSIVLVCILMSSGYLSARDSISMVRSDSLLKILPQLSTSQAKIPVLKDLADLYWHRPEEVVYLKDIVVLAQEIDSVNIMYDAMVRLGLYYYYEDKSDSLLFWADKITALAFARGECPNALFIAKSLISQDYLWDNNYEVAMNEALKLLDLAGKENHEEGLMWANYALALVYQKINRNEDALIAFEKCLGWLDRQDDDKFILLKLDFYPEMIMSCLPLLKYEKAILLFERYDSLLNKIEKECKTTGQNYSVDEYRIIINSYYADLCMLENKIEEARVYKEKASSYISESSTDFVRYIYYIMQASYYQKTGNYSQALIYVDRALVLKRDLNALSLKVSILRLYGKDREAIPVYKELLEETNKINEEAFTRQIAQINELNDLNDQEKQDRILKVQNEQVIVRQRLLVLSVIILFVLLILLYRLCVYFLRIRKLKNELLVEKKSLVESEQQLWKMKEEAILANQMKTAFISNISHEVRTPLNVIVGFSELLTDKDYKEDEKKRFASTINTNSELLMNLINDVLDLSRLEAGNIIFNIQPVDLLDCCRKSMSEMEHRLASGVCLSFVPASGSFVLNTDPYRVQQLLVNLLINAAKFTKEGEIVLSFEIDNERQEVRLVVTDTGCGIPFNKQNSIFERFEKLNEFAQGTGLGLPICRIIADRLGGRLFIDPSYKNGARFVFIHPMNSEVTKES